MQLDSVLCASWLRSAPLHASRVPSPLRPAARKADDIEAATSLAFAQRIARDVSPLDARFIAQRDVPPHAAQRDTLLTPGMAVALVVGRGRALVLYERSEQKRWGFVVEKLALPTDVAAADVSQAADGSLRIVFLRNDRQSLIVYRVRIAIFDLVEFECNVEASWRLLQRRVARLCWETIGTGHHRLLLVTQPTTTTTTAAVKRNVNKNKNRKHAAKTNDNNDDDTKTVINNYDDNNDDAIVDVDDSCIGARIERWTAAPCSVTITVDKLFGDSEASIDETAWSMKAAHALVEDDERLQDANNIDAIIVARRAKQIPALMVPSRNGLLALAYTDRDAIELRSMSVDIIISCLILVLNLISLRFCSLTLAVVAHLDLPWSSKTLHRRRMPLALAFSPHGVRWLCRVVRFFFLFLTMSYICV